MRSKQPTPPFVITIRVFTLCWAVWIASHARILLARSLDGEPFLGPAIAYSTAVVFLLLPLRLLAASRVLVLVLFLPLPVWWGAILVDEVRTSGDLWNTRWSGILLLLTGSFLQAALVWNARREHP